MTMTIGIMKSILAMSLLIFTRLLSSRAFSPVYRRAGSISTQRLQRSLAVPATSSPSPSSFSAISGKSGPPKNTSDEPFRINLSTISQSELETLITAWGHPKFRAKQVYQWIHNQGVTDVSEMTNLPKPLRQQLLDMTAPSSLELILEQESKDGTLKRAYRCTDGQVIESVLMPYQDGRYTACISSQAGCAQGCVFCATGQMGLARQLTSDEIFEQVARFSRELTRRDKQLQQQQASTSSSKSDSRAHGRSTRLSNVVFMGMGEPLANYRHVIKAIDRITNELGIGARKITVSTVGVVPNIRKLMHEPYQVRLAVSLHCATDQERTALLPANRRYGGLTELMTTLQEYINTTGRRLTFEWALIDGENDSIETARTLGRLIAKHQLRRDMVHVNVIPLNPTGGFAGSPSQRNRVNEFCKTLEKEFGIACTPRVRRGIDIDAGCGQLKSKLSQEKKSMTDVAAAVGVYDDENDDMTVSNNHQHKSPVEHISVNILEREQAEFDEAGEYFVDSNAVDFDEDDFDDPEFVDEVDKQDAARLIELVKGTRL